MADFGPEGNRAFAAWKDVFTTKTRESGAEMWITVTSGMSGYFAVQMWRNPDMGGFDEPWDTGFGRYKTRAEAEVEAREWAAAEELEFR